MRFRFRSVASVDTRIARLLRLKGSIRSLFFIFILSSSWNACYCDLRDRWLPFDADVVCLNVIPTSITSIQYNGGK